MDPAQFLARTTPTNKINWNFSTCTIIHNIPRRSSRFNSKFHHYRACVPPLRRVNSQCVHCGNGVPHLSRRIYELVSSHDGSDERWLRVQVSRELSRSRSGSKVANDETGLRYEPRPSTKSHGISSLEWESIPACEIWISSCTRLLRRVALMRHGERHRGHAVILFPLDSSSFFLFPQACFSFSFLLFLSPFHGIFPFAEYAERRRNNFPRADGTWWTWCFCTRLFPARLHRSRPSWLFR